MVQVVVPAVAEDQISEETVVQAEEQAAATEEVALEAKSEPEDFQASISRGHTEQERIELVEPCVYSGSRVSPPVM